jgi:hypothetical protein
MSKMSEIPKITGAQVNGVVPMAFRRPPTPKRLLFDLQQQHSTFTTKTTSQRVGHTYNNMDADQTMSIIN